MKTIGSCFSSGLELPVNRINRITSHKKGGAVSGVGQW